MDVRTPVPSIYGEWLQKYGDKWKAQVEALRASLGAAFEEAQMPGESLVDIPVVFVNRSALHQALRQMKDDPAFGYSFLTDYTAIDESPEEPRFHLVFQLMNPADFSRIRVKCRLPEGEEMATLIPLWPGANWAERELWDMFGIRFTNHPDLRRILMDHRWVGHPMRKDYPVRGYQLFPTPEVIEPELLK